MNLECLIDLTGMSINPVDFLSLNLVIISIISYSSVGLRATDDTHLFFKYDL